ncbi:hypothetical protein QJQ45_023960 [Haematococcus lacustris]|nr:hypothetical protein QJQ45_023960 [Haematococcus lacustris]
MVKGPDQQQLFTQWFRIADQDGDGVVGGAEAVRFFQRSALDQSTLGQVWELASGGAPCLNQMQFSASMRLVALAQARCHCCSTGSHANGGRLPLDQARVTLAGLGPPLPTPAMHGMQQYGGVSYSPQVTGAYGAGQAGPSPAAPAGQTAATNQTAQLGGPPNPLPGPQPAQPSYVHAPAHAGAPAAGGGYAPQFTGVGYQPQETGGGSFAPATPADMARYQAAFQQLDSDRDGLVQGSDCFTFFMQWGLDKAVLRHIWDIVAGSGGALTQAQLVACLYLMDAAKRGIKPPPALPPGPFPPVAHSWSLQSQFGGASALAAPPPSQQAVTAPTMPTLPPRFHEAEPGQEAVPAHRPSQLPAGALAIASGLSPGADKVALEAAIQEATEHEAKLHAAEEQAAASKARLAAFNNAMQEVTIFKSRTNVAKLEAQDQASRLESELQASRKKYNDAYVSAQALGESAAQLREHLSSLLSSKTEAELKLSQLQAEIAAANAVTPADVARMEAEVAQLNANVVAATTARDGAVAQLAALKAQRTALQANLTELHDAQSRTEAEMEEVQREVASLQAETRAARAAGTASAILTPLLSKAAAAYRALAASVTKAGGQVPMECLPGNLGLATWMDDALEGVVDWNDVEEDARGYVLVNALPGQLRKPTDVQPKQVSMVAAPGVVDIDAFGEAPAYPVGQGVMAKVLTDAGFGEPPAFSTTPAAALATPVQPSKTSTTSTPAAGGAVPPSCSGTATPAASTTAAPHMHTMSSGFDDDAFGPAMGGAGGSGAAQPQQSAPADTAAVAKPSPPAAAGVNDLGFDDNAFA